jgi:hypothetical protein
VCGDVDPAAVTRLIALTSLPAHGLLGVAALAIHAQSAAGLRLAKQKPDPSALSKLLAERGFDNSYSSKLQLSPDEDALG